LTLSPDQTATSTVIVNAATPTVQANPCTQRFARVWSYDASGSDFEDGFPTTSQQACASTCNARYGTNPDYFGVGMFVGNKQDSDNGIAYTCWCKSRGSFTRTNLESHRSNIRNFLTRTSCVELNQSVFLSLLLSSPH
jgi:hypothetical protein